MKNTIYKTTSAAAVALATIINSYAGSVPPCACTGSAAAFSNLSGTLNLGYVSNYTFRGQVLDTNVAFVPSVGLNYRLSDQASFYGNVEQVFTTRGTSAFRSQYDLGAKFQLGSFELTTGYQFVNFNNTGTQPDAQYVVAKLAYTGNDVLPFDLNPSISAAKGTSANTGVWYETGVAPQFNFGSLLFTVPVAAGWSSNAYYAGMSQGVSYAYASAGITAELKITNNASIKASVVGYTTDSKLSNANSNFVNSSVGVSFAF